LLLVVGVTAGCSSESKPASEPCEIRPNGTLVANAYRTGMTPVHTDRYAVATANPLATEAACRVLANGGTAADALVTAQTVLGLVEPQASGIGGGAFLLYYDAA
jgi:gamma-glutamyltranspeptidase/glutathione hydrolase